MTGTPILSSGHILIVGAGLAGYHCARNLRETGHTGQITILGAEEPRAYDRPALSKAFLTGTVTLEDLCLDDPENPLDVNWVGSANVIALSREPLGVHTADATVSRADGVVLAPGADACTLPQVNRAANWPSDSWPQDGSLTSGPYLLRTLHDAVALRDRDLSGLRVAVVGGSFLGLEAAASCTTRGAAEVTVVAGETNPGSARLGESVGEATRRLHERHGVRFAPASRASGLRDEPGRPGVTLADGSEIDADVVICAIGARPTTGWLQGGPCELDSVSGAVLCDDYGYTGVPGVWSAGDCAQWFSQASGLRPVGHWQEAVEQARIVAASITGATAPSFQEPYFWSEQYDVRFQGAGQLSTATEIQVVDGSAESGDLLVKYLRDGEEIGILGMNRLREVTRWRKQRRTRQVQPVAA